MKAFVQVYLRQFLAIFLAVAVGSILLGGAVPVFAEKKDPCALELKDGESIPSSFNVAGCLTADGQSSRVPAEADPQGNTPILQVAIDAIDLLVKIIAAVALIVFILGALLTVTSEGKEDRLEKGKSAMMFALIGLIISLFSFVIVTFVQSILF